MSARDNYEEWFIKTFSSRPMPPTSAPAFDFCWAGYQAGAASRDAEVAELKHKLNEPVLLSEWQQLEKERDQLREQVTMLRDKVDWLRRFGCKDDIAFRVAQDALATTEPKP